MDYLDELENQSVYIIREAYKNFRDLALLWSIGKDSTVLLWLMKKAFLGKCPVPLLHIDTTFKIPEMIEYRDRIVQKEGLNLLVHTNEEAIKAGMNHEKGRMECCKALKTDALKQAQEKFKLEGLFLGIRGDEEGSRSKERVFSVRGNDSKWDYKNQAPELWDQYQTSCEPGTHVRINPLLHWREIDVWKYTRVDAITTISIVEFCRINEDAKESDFYYPQYFQQIEKEKPMALIQTVDPEKAEGQVKEVFDTLQEAIGMIPAPMQLASASPELLNLQWQSLQYYSQHPTLGFGLLSTIS